MDKPIVKTSNAPAPISPVRGSGYRLPTWKKADWNHWEQMPHCKIWDIVALSLDLEPSNPNHTSTWPPEYDKRMQTTNAHIECGKLTRSNADWDSIDMSTYGTWALSRGWGLPDRFPIGLEVQTVAPFEGLPTTQISYEPRNAVGKLAIKALIKIEKHTNNKATAKQVMELLQKWADDGDEPDVLIKSDKPKRAVMWITSDRKEKDYTMQACEKTLKEFDRSRD